MSAASGTAYVPLLVFRALMTAICGSTMLEHLHIRNVHIDHVGYYHALEESISSLKVNDLSLRFQSESTNGAGEALLEALSRNYRVQRVNCVLSRSGNSWFSDANQNQLDIYLDRNRKLAQWVKDPKLVPRELWSYAVTLAVKAGINSLFQSLIALSEHQIGLREKSRKRKLPAVDQDRASSVSQN